MLSRWIKSLGKKLDLMGKGLIEIVYDKRQDVPARIIAFFLKGLSYIFKAIVKARYFLYDKRVFKDNYLGCLVIVVGNLTVGGTGKTPVVEKIARELTASGKKVAILSRGYKSKSDGFFTKLKNYFTHGEVSPPKVVSDGETVFLDSLVAGDEPYMLARNLKGVAVVVDKNRVKAGHFAVKNFGVDVLILDDGFQYLPLKGQLQVLLVDKTNPFGNKHLLPRGILREPVSHLKRASYVLLTKSDGNRDMPLENFIRKYNKSAEMIECEHSIQYLLNFHTNERAEMSIMKRQDIACFSAIAVPEGFEKFLVREQANIVHKERFLDHHRFTQLELDDFFAEAKENGAKFVVTTEKDAVRIAKDYKTPIPLYFTKLDINILSGDKDFSHLVDRICSKTSINSKNTKNL